MELASCPFCGSNPTEEIGWVPDGYGGEYEVAMIICSKCHAQMMDETSKREDVISNWNNRA